MIRSDIVTISCSTHSFLRESMGSSTSHEQSSSTETLLDQIHLCHCSPLRPHRLSVRRDPCFWRRTVPTSCSSFYPHSGSTVVQMHQHRSHQTRIPDMHYQT